MCALYALYTFSIDTFVESFLYDWQRDESETVHTIYIEMCLFYSFMR